MCEVSNCSGDHGGEDTGGRVYDEHGGYYVPIGKYSGEGERRKLILAIRESLDLEACGYCANCQHVREINHFKIDRANAWGRKYTCMFCINAKQRKPGGMGPRPVIEISEDGQYQKCENCNKWKHISAYQKANNERGTKANCNECVHELKGTRIKPKAFVSKDKQWKTCLDCGQWVHIDNYGKCDHGVLGRESYCRACREGISLHEYLTKKSLRKVQQWIQEEAGKRGEKFCIGDGCKKCKPWDEFSKHKSGLYGLQMYCKDCTSKKSPERKEMDRRQKEAFERGEHICYHCNESLPLEMFFKRDDYTYGVGNICKQSAVEIEKIRQQNPEVREKINERQRKRYRTDDIFRVQMLIRSSITPQLKQGGWEKEDLRPNQYLKCSYEFFINHLNKTSEYEFGYPGISLDHIIPSSVAKTLDELYSLNEWPNWRLFPENLNSAKGKKIPAEYLLHPELPELAMEIYKRELAISGVGWFY